MSLLGIDVGISGCKAVAFDYEGHTLGQAFREYHLYQPQPGWMELDPAEVWAAVSGVVREAAAAAGAAAAGDKVTALAIATHGESVVPVDATGAPIYRFITAIDTRAVKQMQWWEEKVGAKRLFDITGMPPHPMYTANKLMWLRAYDPAVFNAAARFLCMADFLFTRMGLPPTMDHSLASRTMLQDIRTRKWDPELLRLAGLEAERLSATVPSGTLLGEIAPQVAADLGLAAGAVAVTGGHDHCCGSLGVGATRAGMMMDSTGTVECVTAVMETLVLDDNLLRSNLPVEPHTVAGMYVVLGWSSVGGALLKWYRDTFARAEIAEAERSGRSAYDVILAEAVEGPSPVLILPHFVGSGTPALDPLSKGAILGLTLSTTRGQIVKAIIDSVTYEIKLSIDAMEAAGLAINELRAMGGGTKSTLWLQTKADILGRPVKAMDVSEAPCLGCALLAGVATGVYASTAEAVTRAVRVNRTYEPNPKLHDQYAEKAAVYAEVYPTLKGLNRKL